MSSGRHFLAEIERALTQSRQEFRAVDLTLQQTSATLARSRRREASLYQRMAKRRLVDLDNNTFADELDKADRLASELLSERESAAEKLEQRIESLDQQISTLNAERLKADEALVEKEAALETLLESVDASLAQQPAFHELRETAQKRLDMASAAEEKTAEANERREQKKGPFETDPMFMYLWERGYGTAQYKAGFLTRFMDRQVARHIRFERARQRYHALIEIPKRLAAHTARLEENAAQAASALADFERAADIAAGAEAHEQALESAAEIRDGIDQRITAAETEFSAAIGEREAFASGQDGLFRQAMTVLSEQFKAEPIPQLRREARLTPSVDDDEWVAELDTLRDEQRQLQQYVDDHRGLHQKHQARVNELASIRTRYKDKHFDAFNSRIDQGARMTSMLNEFVRGLMSAEQLWRSIRHAQRFKKTRQQHQRVGRMPNIGRTRIPRMPRSIKIPRSIGRSGGGFRTKGGF
ncbi:MAG: hypothetical protein AAAFM81_08270 [Pseudomonadota bacterium]